MAVKSGIFWVTWANAHAQNSSRIEHLVEPFRSQAIAFIKALPPGGTPPRNEEAVAPESDPTEDLLAEMSNQYVIAYAPTNASRDGAWHDIKVTVDGHHRVRAREGYRRLRPN